jgi:hypothetical protein
MSGAGPDEDIAALVGDAERLLTRLGLGPTFTLGHLHRCVERHRARRVHLIARDLPALAPHGLWIASERADYVFFDRAAGPVLRHQIIGHELGHILHDDPAAPARLDELTAMLLPDVDPAVPAGLRHRGAYDDVTERRAEVFGTVVVDRVDSWTSPPAVGTVDPAALARLAASLERGR